MKRFFILSLTMILALSAWGQVTIISSQKTWTFSNTLSFPTDQAVYEYDGLYFHLKGTSSNDVTTYSGFSLNDGRSYKSGSFSNDVEWSGNRSVVSAGGRTIAFKTNMGPEYENTGNTYTMAFKAAFPGKVFVIGANDKNAANNLNISFKADDETKYTVIGTKAMAANSKGDGWKYEPEEVNAETRKAGTYYIAGEGAYALYAILYVPETVTAPTINNSDGTITITAGASNLSGDGNATIKTYYSTDGTTPTASSKEYEGSFKVATSCTVKAISINSVTGTTSAITSEDVTIAAATHTVTIGTHNHGILTLSCVDEGENTGTCTVGETVTITTGPDAGYTTGTVKAYKTDDENTAVTVTDKTSFVMPDYDVTVKVTYNRANLSVTPNVIGNGSLSFVSNNTDNTKFQIGNTVTITVTPNDGYRLKEGTLAATYNDGVSTQQLTITDNTFTMPGYNVTVSAEFESNTQAATITAEAEQSVIYNGTAQAAVATANAGGVVITYYTNPEHTEGETTTAPTNAGTYYAIVSQSDAGYSSDPVNVTFTINKATLTAKADDKSMTVGGEIPTLTMTVTGFVNEETAEALTTAGAYNTPVATTTATGNEEGTFEITVGGGSATNYSFDYQSGTLTVNSAAPSTYTITPTVSGNGEIHVVSGSATTALTTATEYEANSSVQLVAVPASGYQLREWSGDGLAAGDIPTSIWLNAKTMTSNINLTATFVQQPTVVEAISGSREWTFGNFTEETKLSGTVSYHYNGLYICGHNQNHQNMASIKSASNNSVTFEGGPTVSYTNYLWIAGGQNLSEANAVKAPNEFVKDYVAFKAGVSGTVYVYMGGKTGNYCRIYSGGSLKTTDTALSADNSPVKYTASVDAGEVVRIGTNTGAAYIYAIAFVPASSPMTYTVTGVPDDGNGNKVEASPTSAAAGATITLTITTATNYTLNSISAKDSNEGNVELTGEGNTRTFTMPASNVTVTATFAGSSMTDISGATVTLSESSFIYDGDLHTPTEITVNLNGLNLTLSTDYTVEKTSETNVGTYTVIVTGKGNYTGEAKANWTIKRNLGVTLNETLHWATYYAAEDLAKPEGVTIYRVTGVSETAVQTQEVSYIKANTGVLLYSESAVSEDNLKVGPGSGVDYESELLGSTSTGSMTDGTNYVLYNNQFMLSEDKTLPANHCYLQIPGVSGTRSLTIEHGDGNTTDIHTTRKDHGVMISDKYYTLSGQRIEKPTKKGLYIVNGRKVVIK